MTYTAQETSREGGQPVELYDFVVGDDLYHYTSAEDEIVDGALTYTPVEISRSNILIGAEQRQEVLTVRMPSGEEPASRFITVVPGQRATLTIRRLHRTDTPTPQIVTIFKGVVKSVAYTNDGFTAELAVMPLTGGFSQEVPRYTYQSLCNHVLYGAGCLVNSALFQFDGTVSVVDGNDITVPGVNGEADGYYTGGYVQYGTSDFRLILNHVGNVLTLLLPFHANVLSRDVSVFAGCAHDIVTCKNKFNNVNNYGGFAFVPLRNIFQTGIA